MSHPNTEAFHPGPPIPGQLALTFEPDPAQEPGDIRESALAWIESHPGAMSFLEQTALAAASRGRAFGMKALCERLRWEFGVERGDAAFAVNNSFTAYLARELVRRHPSLAEFLCFRRTRYEAR